MRQSQKRLLLLILSVPLLVVVCGLVYMAGMGQLEGEDRSFWNALEWAGETLSTTGYGGDYHWTHPMMVIFVVVVQFVGVFLVFLIIPIYLIPVLEERFEARLPVDAPKGIQDHVVIFRYGPAVTTLLSELQGAGVPTLVLETDARVARRLFEGGHQVVSSSLEDKGLERAGVTTARSLVANGSDDENAEVSLAARQLGFRGDILALVEEPFHRQPIVLAGATHAFTPRHMLGAALAARASRRISPTVAGIQQIGRHLQLDEIRISRNSTLVGKTLASAKLGERTGVQVIGQWVGGRLLLASPQMRLEADGILVVVGSAYAVEGFEEICEGAVRLQRRGPFVIAGLGEVGRKVAEVLGDFGEEVRSLDRREESKAHVVGDVLDPNVLEEAGAKSCQAVILSLDSDSATLFATVILKDLAPGVPVIARVNSAENVERIYRAGADFALSISQVAGQILATRLLGQEAISVDPQLKILKVSSRGLEGRHPAELGIREQSGCSIVAVERGEDLLVELDEDFRFAEGDSIYICGSADATRRYSEVFEAAA